MEKNNVLICVVMLLISCVVNTSKWAGALPGSPGRLGSHVVVSELQLSATPQPLAGRPLLASDHSTFFLFFSPLCSLLSMSVLQNSCGLQRENSGGEWEKGSWASPRRADPLPLRQRDHQRSGSGPPSRPRRGAGAHAATLIPQKSRCDCHRPLGRTLCQSFAPCHCALLPTPSGRRHFNPHFILYFIYRRGVERRSELNQNSNPVVSNSASSYVSQSSQKRLSPERGISSRDFCLRKVQQHWVPFTNQTGTWNTRIVLFQPHRVSWRMG